MFSDFELTDAQQDHALAIEQLAPRLGALRIELCPGYMSEGSFWKIYFLLLHPRLSKQDAELLSTPQVSSCEWKMYYFYPCTYTSLEMLLDLSFKVNFSFYLLYQSGGSSALIQHQCFVSSGCKYTEELVSPKISSRKSSNV